MKNSYCLSALLVLASVFSAFSQVVNPKMPPSFENTFMAKSATLPIQAMARFDAEKLRKEDKEQEGKIDRPLRFAHAFDVRIDIKKAGKAEDIASVGKIWRIRIKSAGAYSLNFTFSNFHIPEGAELYLYNERKTKILGAITSKDNPADILPVQPINGDDVTIEYFEPYTVSFPGTLELTRIGHAYKDMSMVTNPEYDGQFGTSQSCNENVRCTTTTSNWQTEKTGVCRLLINNTSLCTGSLINNTNNDGKPYVLTANHCIQTGTEAANTLAVFHYESPNCTPNTDGSVSSSISGSVLRATWATSDFSLIELSSVPPFCPYSFYNGWDRSTATPAGPVVCIHHPAGDVKKIAQENDAVTTSGTDFWQVTDYTIGTVEHGSSGGPFFNAAKRIVGQVHGGNNIFCSTAETSTYGKFSSSWTGGGTSSTRLSDWLDPIGSGVTTLNGRAYTNSLTINGPAHLCPSGTYSLASPPSGTTVSWSSSNTSAVTINSSTGVATRVGSFNGSVTIIANVSNSCGAVTVSRTITVGQPSAPTSMIVRMGPSSNQLCRNATMGIAAGHPNWSAQGVNQFNWSMGSWASYFTMYDGAPVLTSVAMFNLTTSAPSSQTLSVTAQNACGVSPSYSSTFYAITCGSFLVSYPNPATDELSVQFDKSATPLPDEISLINEKTGKTVHRLSSDELQKLALGNQALTIPVRSFTRGTYYLHIKNGSRNKERVRIVLQ